MSHSPGWTLFYVCTWLFGQISFFLHNSQFITFPTQSCLVLYSFCDSLLHPIMWLIVSSLSPLHLLFCCDIYFCFNIVCPYSVLLCCYYKKRFSSFLRFLFRSHVQVFSSEILRVNQPEYRYCCFSSHFCFLATDVLFISML